MGSKSPISTLDTNTYFGNDGIFKVNDILRKMGIPQFSENVWAANHARSIADLVIYLASQGKNPCSVIGFYGFDDFMELPSDKEKAFALLEKSLNHIKEDKTKNIVSDWLDKARHFSYE